MKLHLSHLLIVFCALIISTISLGQSLISTVDFETDSAYSTSIIEFSDGQGDFFIRTDSSDHASNIVYGNKQGLFYFAAMDIDGEGATLPVELNIDDISILGFSDLEFGIMFAEDDDGINQDWDNADFVHIQYDIDNSGTFTDLIWVRTSTAGTNYEPSIDYDFNGVGDGVDFITSYFQEFRVSIPDSGSLLDIKIVFSLNAGEEDIAIDNIAVYGNENAALESTWNPLHEEIDIPLTDSITISYNRSIFNVDGSVITNSNLSSLLTFKEIDTNGIDVSFAAKIDTTNQVVTIIPDAALKTLQLYFVAIAAVEDNYNNEILTENISFTTADTSKENIDAITAPTKVLSSNADLSYIKVNNQIIEGFHPIQFNYAYDLPFNAIDIPIVSYQLDDENATAIQTNAKDVTGNTIILVTAEDSLTQKTYTVFFEKGINSISAFSETTVRLYPSRVSAGITIENIKDLKFIQIINSTGSVVYKKKLNGTNNFYIDTSAWSKGLYFLITLIDGKQKTLSFIKE